MQVPNKKQKIYCYVDETGQDTKGELFIVSIIISQNDQDELRKTLETIELKSKKGKRKWVNTKAEQKIAYIKNIINITELQSKFCFMEFTNTKDYFHSLVYATSQAIKNVAIDRYRVRVFVDGLPKSQVKRFGSGLRRNSVRVEKVRGVRKEEADSIMRLADAICGFAREAKKNTDLSDIYQKAKSKDYLIEI